MNDLKLQIIQAKLQEAIFKVRTAEFMATQEGARIRPCHMYPVKIYHNEITWVCESAHSTAAVGCGDSPNEAMIAFDYMWMGIKP